MAEYRIRFRRSAEKEISRIGTKADRKRILARIQRLAENPRSPGVQKLSRSNRYRVRQDNYRILYTINDEVLIIVVVKVGHRSKAYRSRK